MAVEMPSREAAGPPAADRFFSSRFEMSVFFTEVGGPGSVDSGREIELVRGFSSMAEALPRVFRVRNQ